MISLDPDNTWTDWSSWGKCSKTCGEGTQRRFRACENPAFGFCPGLTGQEEAKSCNDGSCPNWSHWSQWGDCSADCNTGIQIRTRTCSSGLENDCAGPSQEEDFCNRHSCSEPSEMYYWNEYSKQSMDWRSIDDLFLPDGDTYTERCQSYCLSRSDCIAVEVTEGHYKYKRDQQTCHVTISFIGGMFSSSSWLYHDGEWEKNVLYVKKDVYEANRSQFSISPTGLMEVLGDTDAGLCDGALTSFGPVNYRNTKGSKIIPSEPKNVIREDRPLMARFCAQRCFEKAGCSAFYEYGQSCTFIMGYGMSEDDIDPEYYDYGNYTASLEYSYDYDPESFQFNPNATDYYSERSASSFEGDFSSPAWTTDVKLSGKLSNLCPQNAFKNTYTKKSQFYCLFFAPDGADTLVDDIVESNTVDPDTPLNVWTFKDTNSNPYTTSSQYVDISMPNMRGTNEKYRPIVFTIETHIRVSENGESKGDHQSIIDINGNSRKRRSIKPRTQDILSEIDAIEQQALNFILEGGMDLPAGIEVAVTGDIETIEIIQTAADGSIAAECSSGSCQCSDGFIDNGNGCEIMTEEAVTTTKVPATQPAETSQSLNSYKVKDWIQSLVDKMQAVFENFRPGRPFPSLLKKWSKQGRKFVHRYERVLAHGCEFPDTYEDASVDFNTIKTCRVSSGQTIILNPSLTLGD